MHFCATKAKTGHMALGRRPCKTGNTFTNLPLGTGSNPESETAVVLTDSICSQGYFNVNEEFNHLCYDLRQNNSRPWFFVTKTVFNFTICHFSLQWLCGLGEVSDSNAGLTCQPPVSWQVCCILHTKTNTVSILQTSDRVYYHWTACNRTTVTHQANNVRASSVSKCMRH